MYYIGMDIHKKTISYCVKDAAGRMHMEGKIGSTRQQLDSWLRTLPRRGRAYPALLRMGWTGRQGANPGAKRRGIGDPDQLDGETRRGSFADDRLGSSHGASPSLRDHDGADRLFAPSAAQITVK